MEFFQNSVEAWIEALRQAKSRSLSNASKRRFKSLHPEQVIRAAYFCELEEVIRDLGLSNAFEKTALSLEPHHPVAPSRLAAQILKMQGLRGTDVDPIATKLSLLSLPMLSVYAPNSEAAVARKHQKSPLNILDPLYGFGYFLGKDNKFHNHCFAIDFWQSRLETMPQKLRSELWSNKSDNMLSGGVFAARTLFPSLIPPESDDRQRSIAPEIIVRSESHLQEVIASFNADASSTPQVQLWFRGQSKDYQVPNRDALLRLGLTPYSNIPESDFTPSLYRSYDSHLETIEGFERLLIDLAQWVNAAKKTLPEAADLYDNFKSKNPHAHSAAGLTSFQRGLLLQQYGAPSAYLDITSNPLTAAWFATNSCTQMQDGELRFNAYRWHSDEPTTWPTIFVYPLVEGSHPFLKLSSILPEKIAMRPERQSCGLLGGAGNLARNYCSRYLGLKLRLAPNFLLSRPEQARFLFPSHSEDPMLAALNTAGFNSRNKLYPVTYVAHL